MAHPNREEGSVGICIYDRNGARALLVSVHSDRGPRAWGSGVCARRVFHSSSKHLLSRSKRLLSRSKMMRLMRSMVFALALIDGIDCTNEVSLQQIEDLLSSSQCQDIYMDVGTNIGVQIRKMYEPHHYTGANMLVHFDKLFGPTPRCGVCTIGLEPNPRHSAKLHSLTRHLQAAGAGVIVLHGAALDRNGSINLQIDSDNSQWDLGASVLSEKSSNARMEQVPAFDLASLVSRMDRHVSRTGGSLMMKMDVEGAELELLSDLLISGSLQHIDRVMVEYHPYFKVIVHVKLYTKVDINHALYVIHISMHLQIDQIMVKFCSY